ncbi:MAG: hypothetical protein CMI18_08250 [Opitutaceae bacterium]|nr:hypothetical protein [Opitutaceae bacterium]
MVPAILLGLFIAFMPLYGIQLITVLILALILKVNYPSLSVSSLSPIP